ncbi:MAG: hypothetical protein M5U22_15885 [Thermoleophilia bacterium]|nr:hypothetical protein [Thermoleophilia bacterium]
MRTRATALLIITLILTTLAAGTALAATPQDIYNDYADDGVLQGTYTNDELQAYLDDATIHQYGDDAVLGPLDALVKSMLAQPSEGRGTFPFTGMELIVVLIGAVVLFGGGIALRRTAR